MIVFLTTLKRIFGQPANWVSVMLFPVLCYVLISITTGDDAVTDVISTTMSFGIVDNDNTAMSEALANQLGLRYNIVEVDEADVSAVLIDQFVPWILFIKDGYEQDVLAGNTGLLSLESYSLNISEMSALGSLTAENITRALMILGTNDEAALAAWAEAAQVEFKLTQGNDVWPIIAQWLAMFGYISIFTAYFVIKTLLDDKRFGMPDRVGVLPISSRSFLMQGTLAAFLTTEITVVLTLVSLSVSIGTIPNVLLLFFLMSLLNLFSVSLILTITSIVKTLGGASVAMAMISTLMAMLGGLFWPIELVPEFMQKVAWFTPGYWFGEGLRNIQNITFEGFVMPMLFLLGFTVVTLLIGGFKKVQKMDEG